ncbi:MAG: M48 family metallopeptidase [Clostridia bacterium]|nr:M48 family metallopeptidase [Clostridia bacterium]MBR2927381.1 M48 family metallopeptidase [Clostridia bacterium]
MKLWILIIFAVATLLRVALHLVHYRSAKNPVPENVADVYDTETYLRWQRYFGEGGRLAMIETLVSSAIMALLLIFDVHAVFASWFGQNPVATAVGVVLCQIVVEWVCSIPFNYISTMKIEEKYGFNRSTLGTFIKDEILGFFMSGIVSLLIVLVLCGSHLWLGNWMILLFAGVMCVFVVVMNLIFPLLSRLQNKFTPLPDGALRDKLTALLTGHGYTVKAIEVMDGSRRSSKSNAFFSGFGKQKRIVLYDTLLESMDEDEICAVFAHELGHGLHHDIPKLLLMNCGNMVLIALLAWGAISLPALYPAFGFDGVNYGFAFLILGSVGMPLISQLYGMLINAVSRSAEYKADAQAVEEGYGESLVSGLKKLSRENFSHLSPSKLVVVLEYSHPPVSARVEAIEARMDKKA